MSMITAFRQVIRYWWGFILSGSLLILLGLLIIAMPVKSFAALSIFFETAIVVNGLFEIFFAFTHYRSVDGWGWHLAGGILDLLVGGLLFSNPVLAAASLVLFVGFWLMFRSIAIIGRCFDLPTVWPERAWMSLLGCAGLISSFMVLYNPTLGAFSVVLWCAFSLVAIGLFYIFLGIHLKGFAGKRGADDQQKGNTSTGNLS